MVLLPIILSSTVKSIYNEVLYCRSYYCLVGRSSGCAFDTCSSMPNPLDVCSSASFAGGACTSCRHVVFSQY